MPGAGDLQDRYRFQRQGEPLGDADQGVFADVFSAWAQTLALKGGEGVQALRLLGKQPVVLTIRVSVASRAVAAGWRVIDARDSTRIYDVTGAEMNADRGFIDVLATRQVGQGG